MNKEHIGLEIEKLEAKTGDVLSLSGPAVDRLLDSPTEATTWLDDVVKSLDHFGAKDVLILLLPTGTNLTNITEGEMNKNGWYRK